MCSAQIHNIVGNIREVLGDLLELWRAEVRHRPWARRVLWLFRQPLATAVSRLRFGRRARKEIGFVRAGRLGASISWLELGARGSQMQLGRTWTALIVVQVAIAVAVLPTAIYVANAFAQYGMGDPGYPAEEFFSG